MSTAVIDKPPTARQLEVLNYICDYIRRHGYSPTVREIGAAFSVHNQAVQGLVDQLWRKGLIRRASEGMARGWLPVFAGGVCPCCRRPMPKGGA